MVEAFANDGGNATVAKDTARAIERIDPNLHGQAFLDEMNSLMQENGLTGTDATSALVVAELHRNNTLPRLIIEMNEDDVIDSYAGNDWAYSPEELQAMQGSGAAGTAMVAGALLERFDEMSDLASLSQGGVDPQSGSIDAGDLMVYAGAHPIFDTATVVEGREAVEHVLYETANVTSGSLAVYKQIASGQSVSREQLQATLAGELSDADRQALQFFETNYDALQSKFWLSADGLDQNLLLNYAVTVGTSQNLANAARADQVQLDAPVQVAEAPATTEVTTTEAATAETSDAIRVEESTTEAEADVADPVLARETAAEIVAIDESLTGQAYADEVNRIMTDAGLEGNDATSQLMIAEIERQGELPYFLQHTLGNKAALNSLAPGQDGYTRETLEKLARGQGPTPGTSANAATRLASQALLERFSAVADYDYIVTNNDGNNHARENEGKRVSVSDLEVYAGTRDLGNDNAEELSRKREQYRNSVNQMLWVTSNVDENDPQVLQNIANGVPQDKDSLQRALDSDANLRAVAEADNWTDAQRERAGIMTDDQRQAVQFMYDHYDPIVGMVDDAEGITNDILDEYGINMGTNREIANMHFQRTAQLDEANGGSEAGAEEGEGSDDTSGGSDDTSGGSDDTSGGSDDTSGGNDDTSGGSDADDDGEEGAGGEGEGAEGNPEEIMEMQNDIVDMIRLLPPDVQAQFADGTMTHDEVEALLNEDARTGNLTVAQRETLDTLDDNWNLWVGKGNDLNMFEFNTPQQAERIYNEIQHAHDSLTPLSGASMGGLLNEEGNLDRTKLEEFVNNPLVEANVDAEEMRGYRYLLENFDNISHDGQQIAPEELQQFAEMHGLNDFKAWEKEAAPTEEEAALQARMDELRALPQTATRGPGLFYELATQTLTDRAAITGEEVTHQAIMREVARILITSEFGPEEVRQHMQSLLDDPNAIITGADLPMVLNYVKNDDEFTIYNEAELERLARLSLAQESGEDANGDGAITEDDYGFTGETEADA
jgi:hypothetical protein